MANGRTEYLIVDEDDDCVDGPYTNEELAEATRDELNRAHPGGKFYVKGGL